MDIDFYTIFASLVLSNELVLLFIYWLSWWIYMLFVQNDEKIKIITINNMNYEKIIQECLSMIDEFDGSDNDYLHLLGELVDECKIRIEGKQMEMEDGM